MPVGYVGEASYFIDALGKFSFVITVRNLRPKEFPGRLFIKRMTWFCGCRYVWVCLGNFWFLVFNHWLCVTHDLLNRSITTAFLVSFNSPSIGLNACFWPTPSKVNTKSSKAARHWSQSRGSILRAALPGCR